MLKICNLEIGGFAALAPMAGVADRAMREICIKYGAGFCVGELTSAKGISLGDKKSAELLVCTQNEKPMASQIFGYEPLVMAKAAEIAQNLGADFIDINMGCPAPKVVNNGSGSALMKNPKLAGEIVKAVKGAVNLPVTAKIRSGWDKNNITACDIAKAAEQAGADMITVHARTRDQMYAPPVDISVIKSVKEAVKIPVVGNGDVTDYLSAKRMYEETGCDYIMVGRAAMGNPFIFTEINRAFLGEQPIEFSLETRLEVLKEQVRLMQKYKGDRTAFLEARKHTAWYLKGIKGASKLRKLCGEINNFNDIEKICEIALDTTYSV